MKRFGYLLFTVGLIFAVTPAYAKTDKATLLIIQPKDCITCNTETPINFLKKELGEINLSYLDYPGRKADKLVRDMGISVLPAYLLDKGIEKEKNFDTLKTNLRLKGDFYILKPQFSGFSYFIEREKIKGRLDLFISLYDKNSAELLDIMREFNPTVHFLANEQENRFDAARGELEVEDYLRAVCVQKYYPQDFWNYISCRAKSINSSWWENCLSKVDADKIRSCALGEEGRALLKDNVSLNKELRVMFGPAYLLNNQEIFGSNGVPTKEELKKIIKR